MSAVAISFLQVGLVLEADDSILPHCEGGDDGQGNDPAIPSPPPPQAQDCLSVGEVERASATVLHIPEQEVHAAGLPLSR